MFSYDLTNLSTADSDGRRNLVRFLIGDTSDEESAPAVFANEELEALLTLNGDSVHYAAAEACETWARTASRLARRLDRDGTIHERWSPTELLATAARLRETAAAGAGATGSRLQTGAIVSSDQQYREERRPQWVSVYGTGWPPL